MIKDYVSSLAFSVMGLIASVVLLTKEWTTGDLLERDLQPYKLLFVAILVAMFLLSLLGIWKSTRQP